MTEVPEENLDYLTARVHGRYSQIAKGERLATLCRLRSLEELVRAVLPGRESMDFCEFQRRMAKAWLADVEALSSALKPSRARMLRAMAGRLWMEDQKLHIRGQSVGLPPESMSRLLLNPNGHPAFDRKAPSDLIPSNREGDPPDPFLLDSAADRDYLQRLLAALQGLDRGDRVAARALVQQEADHFHLMLVIRGHFFHALSDETLLPFHLEGTGITRECFVSMLSAPSPNLAASKALHLALDAMPPGEDPGPASFEDLAQRRFLRLAHASFRREVMGFGTLVGYVALRRMELANLTTLSEGIRLGLPSDVLRLRMEVPHA